MKQRIVLGVTRAAALLPSLASMTGCSASAFLNLAKEQSGQIGVQFVNTTPYRAIFTYGVYSEWDRLTPGAVALHQLRVEGNTTTEVTGDGCDRSVAIGTQALLDRILATDADQDDPNFDYDAFVPTVSFSSAPPGSPAEALPTVGTAEGTLRRLGVDYACNDLLIFRFVEDADARGGFRIDFEVIKGFAEQQGPP